MKLSESIKSQVTGKKVVSIRIEWEVTQFNYDTYECLPEKNNGDFIVWSPSNEQLEELYKQTGFYFEDGVMGAIWFEDGSWATIWVDEQMWTLHRRPEMPYWCGDPDAASRCSICPMEEYCDYPHVC